MGIAAATLLYSAHPTTTATLAETALTTGSPRTGVLDEIRAEVDRAHGLVLASDYQAALTAYQSLRNRIFRLLLPGGPASLPGDRFAAPHDLAHFKEMVRASAVLLADLVPGTPESPVIQAAIDPASVKGYRDGAAVLPKAGDEKSRGFADLATLGQVAFDNGEYELAAKQLTAAAEQAGEDRVARAGLQLNAGAAAVQAGLLDQADQLFSAALDGFQSAKDTLGAAQAAHNRAIAGAVRGDVAKTDGAFKETDERSRSAAGRAGVAFDVLTSLGRTDGTGLLEQSERATSTGVQQVLGKGARLIVRDPLVATAWSSRPLVGTIEQTDRAVTYSAGVLLGSTIKTVTWQKAKAPAVDALLAAGYETRLAVNSHRDLRGIVLSAADLAVQLAHLFYYVIPVAIAEAYAGLGEWVSAREWLYRAADYPYLNKTVEAPALWLRIAQTHLEQGDVLYKSDEFADALAAYGGVVAADGTAGNAPLFTHAALSAIGTKVGALLADPSTLPADLDTGIGAVVLEIAARVRQLVANLDCFWVPAVFVPPVTFDDLQNDARFLGHQAQAAERHFMQFMERYASGRL